MLIESDSRSLLNRRPTLVGIVIAFSIASILVVAQISESIVAGDPAAYRMRVASMLDDGLPYLEVPYEHLPLMLVPMFGAWYLGGAGSQSSYILVFALLMSAVLAISTFVAHRLGEAVEEPTTGRRWVALLIPLIPLVIFRNDPVSVLLALAAMLALARGSRSWWIWAISGAMAKAWPSVLAVSAWTTARRRAILVGLSGVLAVGMTLLPGFSFARQASGIHAETLVGAVVGMVRTIDGGSPQVTITTAAYLDVPGRLVVANLAIGAALIALGVWRGGRLSSWRERLVVAGAITAGVIMGSQLFSLQYVIWLIPFVALSRRPMTRVLTILLGALTTAIAFMWAPERFNEFWFFGLFTVRNALVVAIALLLVAEIRTPIRA